MATTTRNKHRQLAKEAERQKLAQEEESDTDSDYKATNSSKSEEAASDQTISDNDVINISDDDDDTMMMMMMQILASMKMFQKKENLPVKLQDLKQVGYGSSLKKLKIVLKLFV